MIATVQEFIDELNKIDDKSLSICIGGDRYFIDSVDFDPEMNMVYIWPNYRE